MRLLMNVLASLALASLVACAAMPDSRETADAGTVDAGDAPDAGPAPVVLPETPAGAQIAWVVAQLNGNPAALATSEIAAHFSSAFLAAVPSAQIRLVFVQFSAMAPFRVTGLEANATPTQLVVDLADANDHYLRVFIATDATAPNAIAGLLFQLAPDLDPALTDWTSFDAHFKAVAPRSRMLAAELVNGACQPVHAVDAAASGPLGSEFKLYVLAALAAEVRAGTRAWTDTLAIRNDWKSLPSGTWQALSEGTTRTLEEFATQMISVSDNTAADHLLKTVGRENVEAMLTTAAHHEPALDIPFPTTRELFTIKLALNATQRQQYLDADAAGRRALLDEAYPQIPLSAAAAHAGTWTQPLLIDEVEWFASATDVCNVMARLKSTADAPRGAAVYDVLSKNPGLPVDARRFSYIGFKGGSEPGVLTLSWLLKRLDGRWFVVSTAFSDPAAPIREADAEYDALAATVLVGR